MSPTLPSHPQSLNTEKRFLQLKKNNLTTNSLRAYSCGRLSLSQIPDNGRNSVRQHICFACAAFPCCIYRRKTAGGTDSGIGCRLTPVRLSGSRRGKWSESNFTHYLSCDIFMFALNKRRRGLGDQPPHAHDSVRFPTFCSLSVGANG